MINKQWQRVRNRVLATFSMVACLAALSQAATIHLKDGSIIKGTIVSATAEDIQVNSENGLLKINSDRILRVDYSDDASQPALPQTQTAPSAPPVVSEQPDAPMEEAPPVRYVRRPHRMARRAVPAEPEVTNQSFSINLGFSSPLSRIDFGSDGDGSDSNGNTGILLGSQYLYQTTSRLAFGFNLEYMDRSASDSENILSGIVTTVSGDSLVMMPVMKYSFTDRGWVRPYVLAGIGANRTSTFIDAQPDSNHQWTDTSSFETRTLVNDSRWGLAETARIGIDFLQFNSSFFGLEIGWTGISNGRYSTTSQGKDLGLNSVTGNVSMLNVAGRWGWRF